MTTRKLINDFDFILFSLDRRSSLQFTFIDIETERYPSISFLVDVIDHSFKGSIEIWIEKNILEEFYKSLKETMNSREGNLSLGSMSPEEFKLSMISIRKDLFIINYTIKRTKYLNNKLSETILSGSFEYDREYLNKLEQDLRNIKKLFK
ncbi:hypothetical protein [Paenibacillus sp. P32E]|nr:hypothetical protein [Paenibacillus sp. P32E]OKP92958.1 hypothetical protein A3848_06160 [Paenibacillus sp. P32E]